MSLPDELTSVIPQPRAEREMGPVATDLPPLPAPDLPELGAGPGTAAGETRDLRLLADVQVELAVEIGRVKLPLRDLLSLAPGAVLELDRAADAPVDVLVNGCLVARGEVVVIDGEFGVRVTAVVERAAER
jgi:flagellar motor switch protein FliN/FliY